MHKVRQNKTMVLLVGLLLPVSYSGAIEEIAVHEQRSWTKYLGMGVVIAGASAVGLKLYNWWDNARKSSREKDIMHALTVSEGYVHELESLLPLCNEACISLGLPAIFDDAGTLHTALELGYCYKMALKLLKEMQEQALQERIAVYARYQALFHTVGCALDKLILSIESHNGLAAKLLAIDAYGSKNNDSQFEKTIHHARNICALMPSYVALSKYVRCIQNSSLRSYYDAAHYIECTDTRWRDGLVLVDWQSHESLTFEHTMNQTNTMLARWVRATFRDLQDEYAKHYPFSAAVTALEESCRTLQRHVQRVMIYPQLHQRLLVLQTTIIKLKEMILVSQDLEAEVIEQKSDQLNKLQKERELLQQQVQRQESQLRELERRLQLEASKNQRLELEIQKIKSDIQWQQWQIQTAQNHTDSNTITVHLS